MTLRQSISPGGGDFCDDDALCVVGVAVGGEGHEGHAVPLGVGEEVAEDVEVALGVGDGADDVVALDSTGTVAFGPLEVLRRGRGPKRQKQSEKL